MIQNKMIEIRKAIQEVLKEIHPRVFYESAPAKEPYPYIVFNFPNSVSNGILENFVLEVDGWDAPADGSTLNLEALMGEVDKALQRRVIVIADDLFLSLYRDGRETMTENDSRIKRRRLTYQARVYGE